jgi:chromosome segregation ATPase
MLNHTVDIISLVLNFVLGGGIVTLFTFHQKKQKAAADAEIASAQAGSQELDNVEKAIAIWRDMAENLRKEMMDYRDKYEKVYVQVLALKRSIDKLNATNTKILKMLNKINPENWEKTINEIKSELDKVQNA